MPPADDPVKNPKRRAIDRIDARIITLLQKDGRLSNTDIAKQLGLSEATVRSRLKRLMEEEFIQIVAVSNPLKLGFEITGDLYIRAELRKIQTVIQELKKIQALWYIVLTTGETSINAEFVVTTRDELNDLIFNRISRIDGVLNIETRIILAYEKRRYEFGTAVT
ncbi:MAG: Lrp/AsnC family transcriptional regulator [Thermodesulfobacteriota bacterium]